MKHLFFAGLLLAAVTFNANKKNAAGGASGTRPMWDTATIAGNWHLIPVLPSDTAAGKIPTLNFDLSNSRFSGNNGCNRIGGSFFVKDDALRFGENIVSTKMACPGYNEKLFVDNLLKTNRYLIRDGVLQLMYNTTILSKWVRSADASAPKKSLIN